VFRCSRCDILFPGSVVRVKIIDIQRSVARTDSSTNGLLLLCLLYFDPMVVVRMVSHAQTCKVPQHETETAVDCA
jgi:hypothetical protein